MKLEINRDGAYCGKRCVFLDTIYSNDSASCLLFNVELTPARRYDYVENWHTCAACGRVCRNSEYYAEEFQEEE